MHHNQETMAILLFLLLIITSGSPVSYTSPLPMINESSSSTNMMSLHRRTPTSGSCGTGNPVDDCWRCDLSWSKNRQRLADCAVGFGRNATSGRNGKVYVVTDPGDDDPARPRPGTLRHGLFQDEPLWIVFSRDMTIRPKQELLVTSHKTVDGRGARVVVGEGGACFTLRNVSNVIIHGVTIRNCKPARKSATTDHEMSDGDGISITRSRDVWIDHCSMEACADGLVDVIQTSTAITVSNCLFTNHDKAMLLGHKDAASEDRSMRVTIAFNRFGPGLVQRMPRCRLGVFHVVNNDYVSWEIYAIGGSASPTILSRGNRFYAGNQKEVTKRNGDAPQRVWRNWNWISVDDLMLNGAFFTTSGARPEHEVGAPNFAKSVSFVPRMTASAGALSCNNGRLC